MNRSPIGIWAITPKMMNIMEGGMIGASTLPAAVIATETSRG